MNGLRENLRDCLFILTEIARFRKEEKLNRKRLKNKYCISLGNERLVHNFTALIYIKMSKPYFDYYIENKWAIFVPSIQYVMDLIKDQDIIIEKDGKLFFSEDDYKTFHESDEKQQWLENHPNINKLIKSLYPKNDQDKNNAELLKANVRMVTCLLSYGRRKMKKSEMKKCFKNVEKWKWDDAILKALRNNSMVTYTNKQFRLSSEFTLLGR